MKTLSICLEGFSIDMLIGIEEADRARTVPLTINLKVDIEYPNNDFEDDIHNVINYGDIRKGILDIASQSHLNLLETFSEKIIAFCFSFKQVHIVDLQVLKPEIFDDIDGAGIQMIRERA